MIQTIIFDLGGVILDLDIPGYRAAMSAALGGRDMGDPFRSKPPQFFYDLERGKISPDQFVTAARDFAQSDNGHELDEGQFLSAFNRILGGVPEARLAFLDSLKDQFDLYLLSNTNAIHAQAFEPLFLGSKAQRPITSYFHEVFYSHELGERKPDRAIYEAVIAKAGLRTPETALFIDDLAENIEAAKASGLQGHHLTGELLTDAPLRERLGLG